MAFFLQNWHAPNCWVKLSYKVDYSIKNICILILTSKGTTILFSHLFHGFHFTRSPPLVTSVFLPTHCTRSWRNCDVQTILNVYACRHVVFRYKKTNTTLLVISQICLNRVSFWQSKHETSKAQRKISFFFVLCSSVPLVGSNTLSSKVFYLSLYGYYSAS